MCEGPSRAVGRALREAFLRLYPPTLAGEDECAGPGTKPTLIVVDSNRRQFNVECLHEVDADSPFLPSARHPVCKSTQRKTVLLRNPRHTKNTDLIC